uniref:Uncharacterized protein n=1 Tax=Anas zonorhyncha TaxID=75864 RepID=A0A8B9UCC0_9AVES
LGNQLLCARDSLQISDSHPFHMGWCSRCRCNMDHRLEARPAVCALHRWQV